MDKQQFNDRLKINKHALDEEWLNQPAFFFEIACACADARAAADKAKEAVEMAKAKADSEVRSDPEKYGIAKITEGAVAGAVIKHKDAIETSTYYAEMRYNLEVMIGAVRTLDQRKSALEDLVRLHGQSYYSAPSVVLPDGENVSDAITESSVDGKAADRLNQEEPRRRRTT